MKYLNISIALIMAFVACGQAMADDGHSAAEGLVNDCNKLGEHTMICSEDGVRRAVVSLVRLEEKNRDLELDIVQLNADLEREQRMQVLAQQENLGRIETLKSHRLTAIAVTVAAVMVAGLAVSL